MPEHLMKDVTSENPNHITPEQGGCDHLDSSIRLQMGAPHPVLSIKSELSDGSFLRPELMN